MSEYSRKLSSATKRILSQAPEDEDLESSWEVLAEPIQTVMRRHGIENPYEKLKEMTRGKAITRDDLHQLINSVELPDDARQRLLQLTPQSYTGNAEKQAKDI